METKGGGVADGRPPESHRGTPAERLGHTEHAVHVRAEYSWGEQEADDEEHPCAHAASAARACGEKAPVGHLRRDALVAVGLDHDQLSGSILQQVGRVHVQSVDGGRGISQGGYCVMSHDRSHWGGEEHTCSTNEARESLRAAKALTVSASMR